MIKHISEVEIFYERNENGYIDPDLGSDHIGYDTYWNEIGNLRHLIQQNLKRHDFRIISSDTHQTINSVSSEGYIYENEYSYDYDIQIEIVIKLTELNDKVKKRLTEYGYNQKMAEQETDKGYNDDYWQQRCWLYKGKLGYYLHYGDVESDIEKTAKQLIGGITRDFDIYQIFENDEYREWLKNRIDHPEDIIIYAPIDIWKKETLLHKLKYVHSFSGGCGSYNLRTSPVSMFVLHEKMRDDKNGICTISERVTIHRTYSELFDTIMEKYSGKEPDEFDCRWNIVERFDLRNGEYCKTGIYLVSEKCNFWNAYNPTELIDGNTPKQLCHTTFALPAPFESGDIVTLDCRPFREVCHAVVIIKGDDNEVYSPYCLWIQDGKLIYDELCQCCDGFESISPFYKLARYEEELPENESILNEVSVLIKTRNEDLEKLHVKLRKIVNDGTNWKEELSNQLDCI